jgi:hypothetical protein
VNFCSYSEIYAVFGGKVAEEEKKVFGIFWGVGETTCFVMEKTQLRPLFRWGRLGHYGFKYPTNRALLQWSRTPIIK